MAVMSKFLSWSVLLQGVSYTLAAPQQGKCLPAVNAGYTANITFTGCYTDDSTRILQGGSTVPPNGNDPQSCADSCGASGFTYAGVEYGR